MKHLFILTSLACILFSCSKEENNPSTSTTINVSCQQYVDALGNDLHSSGDCTTGMDTAFTPQQIALFSSLDTVDLTGTIKPDSTKMLGAYPNPFYIYVGFHTASYFRDSVAGSAVVKYVLTDSLLNPVFKTSARLTYNPPSSVSSLALYVPGLAAGNYRLFYTFSALGNNNYKRAWINLTAIN